MAKVLELQLQHQSFQWIFRTEFPLGWTGLISLQSKKVHKCLLQHLSSKGSILQCLAFFMVQLFYPYMTTGKSITFICIFVWKVMSLLFNMLSRFVIALLPRSKCLLISWLHSPSAVILEPRNIKICHSFPCSSSICYEVMGLAAMILAFWMLSFKPAFSLSSFHPHQEAL